MTRKYTRRKGSNPPGRPPDPDALGKREGISRAAAWWRKHRSTGKPRGRPKLS